MKKILVFAVAVSLLTCNVFAESGKGGIKVYKLTPAEEKAKKAKIEESRKESQKAHAEMVKKRVAAREAHEATLTPAQLKAAKEKENKMMKR